MNFTQHVASALGLHAFCLLTLPLCRIMHCPDLPVCLAGFGCRRDSRCRLTTTTEHNSPTMTGRSD